MLLLVLVSPLQAREKIYTGQYRYLADAGLFEDCLSGDRWPVAMKAANAELERIYLEERSGGEPLWVKVEGEVQRKLDLEAGKRRLYFVVSRVLESGIRECDPLSKVPLEGTPWVLVELGGRRLASGKRRDVIPTWNCAPARQWASAVVTISRCAMCSMAERSASSSRVLRVCAVIPATNWKRPI